MKNKRGNRCIGRHAHLIERIGRTGTNARKAAHASLFKNDNGAFGVFSAWRIDLKREQRLKGAMKDAQVTTGAIVLNDGHHGLTHGIGLLWMAIMLCLNKMRWSASAVVKFIGLPHQPRYGGEVID